MKCRKTIDQWAENNKLLFKEKHRCFHQLVEQSNILRFDPSIWSYVLLVAFSCPDMKRVNSSKNLEGPMHNFKSFRAVSFQTYVKRSKEKSNWAYRVNMGSISFFRWAFHIIVKGLKRFSSLTFPWKIDDTLIALFLTIQVMPMFSLLLTSKRFFLR